MGTSVRELLDVLGDQHGKDALNPLLDRRGLDRCTSLADKKARLARSYRGKRVESLQDLRLADLRTLAKELNFELRPGEYFGLPRPGRCTREQLVGVFTQELAHDEVPPEMVLAATDEDDVDDEAPTIPPPAHADAHQPWSRPRKFRRVMASLGLGPEERLRTKRFQEVLELARQAGLEMCPTDDDRPFRVDAETPGTKAKVRLRPIAAAAGTEAASIVAPGSLPSGHTQPTTSGAASWTPFTWRHASAQGCARTSGRSCCWSLRD